METKKNYNSCDKGINGDCCCNCINLVTVNCHPSNQTIGKGSILKPFGYGCKAKFGDEPKDDIHRITFSESIHGMCELHQLNIK